MLGSGAEPGALYHADTVVIEGKSYRGTGQVRTVRELREEAFRYVGFNWQEHVAIDHRFVRPTETGPTVADPAKAFRILGWRAKTTFSVLISMMVDAHLAKLKA